MRHAPPTWAWVPTGQFPVCQQEQQPTNLSLLCSAADKSAVRSSTPRPLQSLSLAAEPINGDRYQPLLPFTAVQRSALGSSRRELLVASSQFSSPATLSRETERDGACIVLPDHRHEPARRGAETSGDGAAARCVRELGLLRDSEPRHLDGADGRGREADQGALQAGARAEVPRVRRQGAEGRLLRRAGREGGGEPGLGEHLLRPPPPRVQHCRDTGPRRAVPARDEAVRRRAGGAGGAAAGPAVREPRPGQGVPGAGVPRAQHGHPDVRHQGEQLPTVPAAGPRERPARTHRRRRHHPAVPGRPRRRAAAAQGRRVGGRAALAPLHRRQPGRPAGGDHQRQVQERGAPGGGAARRQQDVHRLLLQPRQRRGHLPRAATGEGRGRRRRGGGVPQLRLRGLHEAVRAAQVRGQGATLPGLQVHVHGDPQLQPRSHRVKDLPCAPLSGLWFSVDRRLATVAHGNMLYVPIRDVTPPLVVS